MPAPPRPAGRCPHRCSRTPRSSRGRSNGAPAFTTPLRTASPTSCSTGSGSPVSALSSSTATSCSTRPSTGTTSPGSTIRRSPGRTSSSDGDVRSWSEYRCTMRGARSSSARSSRRARAAARASSARPLASITEMTAPAKYSPISKVPTSARSATTSTPSRRRRAASTTHHAAGTTPATVTAAHTVSAADRTRRGRGRHPPPSPRPRARARTALGFVASPVRRSRRTQDPCCHRARPPSSHRQCRGTATHQAEAAGPRARDLRLYSCRT